MPAEPHPMPLVLMYHSVSEYEHDPFQVTVTPQRFERQLRWMCRHGLRGASVSDVLAAGGERGLVGLSFDDGYADFATHVAPALHRYGFGATVYVLAGRLGGHNGWETCGPRKPLMTSRQVREVAEAGFEVGSHGLRHTPLPAVPAVEVVREVGRSREVLEGLTGRPVRGFTYPYGQLGAREVAAVRDAGYDHGCAIWRSEHTGRLALPRTYVGERDGALRLLAKRARHRLRSRERG